MIVPVPSWAYDFCYYYLALAALIVVFSVYSIVQLIFLPAIVQKVLPTGVIAINLAISATVTVLLTMMQFWICRSALKPSPAVLEKFAVACASDQDCVAVAGTQPEKSLCNCGGRGYCGGCVMNSNMEAPPGNDLAPFSEGFQTMQKKAAKAARAARHA